MPLTVHSQQKYSCPVMAVRLLDVCRLLFVHYDCGREIRKLLGNDILIFQLKYINPVH